MIETAVIAREDNYGVAAGEAGAKYLCAYIVADRELAIQDLRAHLSETLPEYMIPSYFIQLEQLPQTPNGKIDRKALPQPETRLKTGLEYAAPRNELEIKLALLWQEILGIEKVGIQDNFFELGGHSLKALTLVNRIHQIFEVEIAVDRIFTNPTIKELGSQIKDMERNAYSAIYPVGEQEYYPLSSAQNRIFILSWLEGIETSYNIPLAIMVEGIPDRARLEASFQALIQRHETLRTDLSFTRGNPSR